MSTYDDALRGLMPGVPLTLLEPTVTVQPLFLPGTIEAAIEDELKRRGWSWHLVRVTTDRALALLERDPEPVLGETQRDYTAMVLTDEWKTLA